MADAKSVMIFTYGTLKKAFGNQNLMQDLISKDDAIFVGTHVTHQPLPLVVGPHRVPCLINLPDSDHRVRGELYSVSTWGLARLDELEGVSIGHYQRLPIQVPKEQENDVILVAEACFAHRTFVEKLWEKKGESGNG